MINRVCLALIHNNNVLRNAYIRPQLENLLGSMGPHIVASKIEASFQSEVRPHSTAMVFMRDLMYRKLDRDWHRYRLLQPHALLRDVVGFLKCSFIKYIIKRDELGEPWKKNSAVEVMVTAKHVRTWGNFLDSDADFLLCFEDDAVFKDDSYQKVNELLKLLAENHRSKPCYIDLGGGCRLSDLIIEHLEEDQDESYRYYSKPVTNTACAYLMSRQLVAIFHTILTRRPWLRLMGIDWMMNSLFISMANDGIECVCMHADPTIVNHGTTTGEYVSWQSKK
jgi:hypothetical protein